MTTSEECRAKAHKCRALIAWTTDAQLIGNLASLADECDRLASAMEEARSWADPPPRPAQG